MQHADPEPHRVSHITIIKSQDVVKNVFHFNFFFFFFNRKMVFPNIIEIEETNPFSKFLMNTLRESISFIRQLTKVNNIAKCKKKLSNFAQNVSYHCAGKKFPTSHFYGHLRLDENLDNLRHNLLNCICKIIELYTYNTKSMNAERNSAIDWVLYIYEKK